MIHHQVVGIGVSVVYVVTVVSVMVDVAIADVVGQRDYVVHNDRFNGTQGQITLFFLNIWRASSKVIT